MINRISERDESNVARFGRREGLPEYHHVSQMVPLGSRRRVCWIIIAASSELVRWAQDCTVRSKMSIATTRTSEVPFFFVFPFIKNDL
jgi:hypothetical protein